MKGKKRKRFGKVLLTAAVLTLIWAGLQIIGNGSGDNLFRMREVQAGYQLSEQGRMPGWSAIPLTSEKNKTNGYAGGEGGQWPHALERGSSGTMFYGTNTGGIYRSSDQGKSWQQVNKGFRATGANAFAIDPKNSNRVLAAGIGSDVFDGNGLYLSVNGGESWQLVKPLKICGNKYIRDGLTFDEFTGLAYYSTPFKKDTGTKLKQEEAGLYRSGDGGETWELACAGVTDGWVKTDPNTGDVYVVTGESAQVSRDFGCTFTVLYEGEISGFDVYYGKEKGIVLYLSTPDGLLKSTDKGETFETVSGTSYPSKAQNPKGISVSPYNPQHLLLDAKKTATSEWSRPIWYSEDGGVNWAEYRYDNSNAILPFNCRDKLFAWKNDDDIFSFGGDGVISSQNGGKNWEWSSNGICGILSGGKFHFNVYDPNLMYFASQDYNGAITEDGGETWRYINLAQASWGGFVYAGYAASKDVIWGGVSQSWYGNKELCITFDGGKTVTKTGSYLSGRISNQCYSSYQSPTDKQVFFASDLRSKDGGNTWSQMSDCLQVYTHNPTGRKELYGCSKQGGYVLVSYNSGEDWTIVNKDRELSVDEKTDYITDIAVDAKGQNLYVTSGLTRLYRISMEDGSVTELSGRVPANERGKRYAYSVDTDPESEGFIYLAVSDYSYNSDHSLLCSDDGGQTWYVMNPNDTNSLVKQGNAGFFVRDVNVNPLTGSCWCSCGCYGFAKLTGAKELIEQVQSR